MVGLSGEEPIEISAFVSPFVGVESVRCDGERRHREGAADESAAHVLPVGSAALNRLLLQALGMRVLRATDRPEQKYTRALVGYGDERENAVLKLTYNYGGTTTTWTPATGTWPSSACRTRWPAASRSATPAARSRTSQGP
jgi:hypothetical protein